MNPSPQAIADVALDLVRRLGAARDVHEALGALLDGVVAATGVDVGAVYRWDIRQVCLVRVATTPPPPDFDATVEPGRGAIGEAVERRAPRVLDGHSPGSSHADDRQRWGLRSLVAVPLLHADRLSGAVVVGRRSSESTAGDVDVLDVLATLAAPAVALTEANGHEAGAWRRLDTLARAARELAHDLNNDLTMPMGALELMRERDDMPADVRELIAAAAEDLARIEARIRDFQQVARVER